MNSLTYGVKIIVESTGRSYHTLDTWGLALGNNNYISAPEQETAYINVPFRDGYVDISEAVSGRPIFKNRELSFELGGINPRLRWDNIISEFRNAVHGKLCRVVVDNDAGHFWRGRVYITDFDRTRELGTLKLTMPTAEPYKRDVVGWADEWEWDSFSFVDGTTQTLGDVTVRGSANITIPAGEMLVAPSFRVSNITSSTRTVSAGGRTYNLVDGLNYFPSLLAGGSSETVLRFSGNFHVLIDYRGGSL